MNNIPTLTIKQNEISFKLNDYNSSYESSISLTNEAQQSLYFKIVSTFGKLLTTQQLPIRKVQPHKTLVLFLKLKIPNQIKKHSQKIVISFSNQQISSKIKGFQDQQLEVKIKFDQNLPEQDQVISQILQADCKQLCQEASELFKKGQIKNALYKYQESFLLLRQFGEGLYGMAECLYLTQSWDQALQSIQTALITHDQEKYLWLKLKIFFQMCKQELNNIRIIRSLKRKILKITSLENIEQKKKQMLGYLQKQEEKINAQKGGKLMYQFIEKALSRYQTDKKIKQIYPDHTLFEKQLHQVLKIGAPHTIQQTPQFVLDPITYQIIKDPLIVPSGHSFERVPLYSYLQKNGNKDMYTRQQLRYEWARPNLALKKYIQKNPDLPRWLSYEKQIITFK